MNIINTENRTIWCCNNFMNFKNKSRNRQFVKFNF